jgi:hypothetical protein
MRLYGLIFMLRCDKYVATHKTLRNPIMLNSILLSIKNLVWESNHHEEIRKFFDTEYKKQAPQAYKYWLATGNFHFES